MSEILIDVLCIYRQLIGKNLQVPEDISSCLVLLQIIMVEIPIEGCFSFLLQTPEQLLLDFLQQVKAYKEIPVVIESLMLVLGDLAIKGSFVA